jgi:hypothetical protein
MIRKDRDWDRLVRLLTVDKHESFGKIPAMPNKRAGDKAFTGGYIPKAVKQKFKAMADKEARGDTVKMLCKLIEEGFERRDVEHKKGKKNTH